MKAVFLDYNTIGPNDLDPSPLMRRLPDLKLFDSTLPEEISPRIKDAEFILTNKVKLNADNLKDAKQLKFIGLTATGADNIDLKYAQENTIRVCNIRAYCTQSVVEHVFGVILNLTHNIQQYDKLVANGAWQQSDDFCVLQYPIKELSAMTLGIVGYGELGSSVAKMGSHFGMRVLITTRSKKSLNENEKSVSLQKLLKHSDVISLHCPLTDLTKNLIGEKEFTYMKSNAILINTARGGLVDSSALRYALSSKKIAAAAIDVLSEEPPVNGDCLLDYKGTNLIITPHIAWGTTEARQNAVNQLAETVQAFQEGKEFNVIA